MENENQKPLETNQAPEVAPAQETPTPTQVQKLEVEVRPAAPVEKPKEKKAWKYVAVVIALLAVGALAYFGYQRYPEYFKFEKWTEFFKAEITPTAEPVAGVANLYIPNYKASAQDTGTIAVKVRNFSGLVTEQVYSMQFTLKWTPVDALTFNENSIVFDHVAGDLSTTLFSSADLKSVNTDTPGQAIISFFSNTPVDTSPAVNNVPLVKLATDVDGTAGSDINLSVEDVEVIRGAPAPDLFAVSGRFTAIDADKISLVSQAQLRVVNAEAIDANHVLIRFSDLLQGIGAPGDYAFSPSPNLAPPFVVTNVESGYLHPLCGGCDQSTVIVTNGNDMVSDVMYTLEVLQISTFIVQGNVEGRVDEKNYSQAIFDGYKEADGIANSTVTLQSIDVNSPTELLLRFSGGLDASTVTPINIAIQKQQPSVASLTITDVAIVNASTVRLTTGQQSPDANYFIKFTGVKDQTDLSLPLINNKIHNFFGFPVSAMSIANLSPNTVTNEVEQVIVVLGQNLDTVVEARVSNTPVTITEQTPGALSFTLPIGFAVGVYDVTLVSQVGETKSLTDALVVNAPETPMQIISGESNAIPYRIPPDGETEVTFWVLVEDPVALGNIDSVTIDLEQIGGNRAQEMEKDAGLQPQYQQFYTYTTTVDATIPTSQTPYRLAVQVRKGAEVANGTVEIVVTRDVLGSVAPTIDQAYINPVNVAPDGETPVTISAKVSDPDGANTIASVVADLGPLGIGFVVLNPIQVAGEANEQVTGWFASDEFTVPIVIQEGNYVISVTAEDTTGESSSKTVNLAVTSSLTGPEFDRERSYIGPRKSVPNDGKTLFAIHAIVKDPNGVSDIDTVTAYFETLGLPPAPLLRDPNASEAAKSALYSSGDLTIPPSSPIGLHEIEVVATDSSGGSDLLILQIDATYKDVIGDTPIVFDDKAYTTPKIAINDGQTRITLYAFVRDDDDDLESVVVNLAGVGQVGPETPPDFGEVGAGVSGAIGDGTCPTNSTTIVCMQPSFKEGRDGQWFVLPDVTIATTTPASSEPYMVEVIATDRGSKTSRGVIPISVRDSQGFIEDSDPPEIVGVVPTAAGKVEVVFNEELSSLSISSDGSEFTITLRQDVNQELNIVGATINATGNVVTLTTDSQDPGQEYVLTASNEITDAAGIALVPGAANRVFFDGFEASDRQPVIHYVAATDMETVEIEFQDNLKPSSVKLGETMNERGGDFDIKIMESETSLTLPVMAVNFLDSGKLLEVKTAIQKSGAVYRLQLDDIASYAGVVLKQPVTKTFKAVKIRAIQRAAAENQADLNGDGRVDFIDFTIFSSVYGQVFGNAGSGPSPIPDVPDATVPVTTPAP